MEPIKVNAISDVATPATGCPAPDQALAALAELLDPDRCRRWMLSRVHEGGAFCPGCGRPVADARRLQRFWSGSRLCCRHCGKFFTAATDTFLAGSQMGYAGAVFLMAMLAAGLGDKEIGRLVGCSRETVRLWRLRFDALKKLKEEAFG